MRTVIVYTRSSIASCHGLEQQTAKYIHELKYPIQERVALQDLYSVDELQNKVMKIERLQNKAFLFKNATERTSGGTRTQQDFTSNR